MTKKVFWSDPYLTKLSTTVATVSGADITLSETIFFAFSGGQESDIGTIDGQAVIVAQKQGLYVTAEVALAQASALVVAEGFAAFVPHTTAYTCVIGKFPPERLHIIPVREIEPPLRMAGVALFPRATPILSALRDGVALPPIEVELLPAPRGPYRYRARDGFHRYYLVRALGFAALPAIVWPYFDPDGN